VCDALLFFSIPISTPAPRTAMPFEMIPVVTPVDNLTQFLLYAVLLLRVAGGGGEGGGLM